MIRSTEVTLRFWIQCLGSCKSWTASLLTKIYQK